jgi:hypothetical protein
MLRRWVGSAKSDIRVRLVPHPIASCNRAHQGHAVERRINDRKRLPPAIHSLHMTRSCCLALQPMAGRVPCRADDHDVT